MTTRTYTKTGLTVNDQMGVIVGSQFREGGPLGYRAATLPNPPIRATRAEAIADEVQYLDGERVSDLAAPGVIFVSRGGYEQTNRAFYQVVGRSAVYATIRQIRSRTTRVIGSMSSMIEPVPGDFSGEPIRRKPFEFEGVSRIVISGCERASVWNGADCFTSDYH